MLSSRYLPDVVALAIFWFLQSLAALAFLFGPAARESGGASWRRRSWIVAAWAASGGLATLGFIASPTSFPTGGGIGCIPGRCCGRCSRS